jgi:hypothetical protein
MPDAPADLLPAAHDEVAEALSYALRFDGRKRLRGAQEVMAVIVAERLVDYLSKAGFVVMKRAPAAGHAGLARGANSSGR